jgi:hypothetical protein
MMIPHKATPKIEFSGSTPRVIVTQLALQKMGCYVALCDKEIGWLGTARMLKSGNIAVEDVYLFEQEVASTTCEINPAGLAKFADELVRQDGGVEIYNNIRLWGHSHVNMGVSPSGQDDTQLKFFKDSGHDWFLRVIANKDGRMEFTLADFTHGMWIKDIAWEIYSPAMDGLKDQIKKEIDEKVSLITYSYGNSGTWGSGRSYDDDYYHGTGATGYWTNGRFVRFDSRTETKEEKKEEKSRTENESRAESRGSTGVGTDDTDGSGSVITVMLRTDEEIEEYFADYELFEFDGMARERAWEVINESVSDYLGYPSEVDEISLNVILQYARKYVKQYMGEGSKR